MLINFLFNLWSVWERCFANLCLEVGRPRDQKTLIIQRLFWIFVAISANWSTRDHMIDFLVNSALNLRPNTHQNSTQEAPKINQHNQKQCLRYDCFLIDFYRFWRRLGLQVRTMLRPCWSQNLQKNDFKNKANKHWKTDGRKPRKDFGNSNLEVLGVFKTTTKQPSIQGYKEQKHALTASAVADMIFIYVYGYQ